MGSSTGAGGRGESRSPKQPAKSSPPRQDGAATVVPESKQDPSLKSTTAAAADTATTNAEATKPLAPPPRPGQQQSGNSPDYFSQQAPGSLSLEPNPFEQSFSGGALPETPGGTKLPPVAALTSPSALLPNGTTTPFTWGAGSLRTGPLSPAMLSGPTTDYFSDNHLIRGGFPTPNESSLRTGLTPGGSGSMFPAPSPTSQTLFGQLAGSTAATPGTIDFHRTALSAAAAKREQARAAQPQQQPVPLPVTSQPPDMLNGIAPLKPETKPPAGPYDTHDNDAANGLFMLAQGRNGSQSQPPPFVPVPPTSQGHHVSTAPAVQPINTSPQMNGNASIAGSSARGVSEGGSAISEESETPRPNTRAKGKRASGGAASSRRKAEDSQTKAPPAKKAKTNGGGAAPSVGSVDMDHSDDDDMGDERENGTKSKMTDEEKRKNFLERNRVAALKCRQRKKQWLANLQSKVELYSTENDQLSAQITQLREEVVNLKTLLLAHKDCPVTQQQGLHGGFMQGIEPFNAPMNPIAPYGMAGPMPSQPVMAGQGVNRRFS